MAKSKNEIVNSQMLFFTKIIVTMLVLTLFILLNFLDLKDSQRSQQTLNMLSGLYSSRANGYPFEQAELKRVTFLQMTNPALGKKHIMARSALVDLLSRYNMSISGSMKGANDAENRFVLMKRTDLTPSTSVGQSSAANHVKPTIDSALKVFQVYGQKDTVGFLINFDSLALKSAIEALVLKNHAGDSFKKMSLSGQLLLLELRSNEPSSGGYGTAGGMVSQNSLSFEQNTKTDTITVKALLDTMVFPSRLQFAGMDSAVVASLYDDPDRQESISKNYGFFGVDAIDNLSSQQFEKNNRSIAILGFDISRKWFPLAMILLLCGVYVLLYQSVKEGYRQQCQLVPFAESEDVMQFLISTKSLRLLFWVLAPLLIFVSIEYATLSAYDLPTQLILILSTILCLFYGIMSFKKSMRIL